MAKKKKSSVSWSGPVNDAEMDRWQAEAKVVEALRDSPEFKKAVSAQIRIDKKQSAETRKIVREAMKKGRK